LLSILFMRFYLASMFSASLRSILSILFMRFGRANFFDPYGWVCMSFNSLYEILEEAVQTHTALRIFQFSLWDSWAIRGYWYSIVRLSFNSLYEIPTPPGRGQPNLHVSFNSLYEIPVNRSIPLTALTEPFNSLYEIPGSIVKLTDRLELNIHFQFSLWDSVRFTAYHTDIMMITFNSLYEIHVISSYGKPLYSIT